MIKILIRKWVLMIVLLALSIAPMLGVDAREEVVQLVLWHSKQGAQFEALQTSIRAFQKLHPTIAITPVYYGNGTLQPTFGKADAAQSPDMILAANDTAWRLGERWSAQRPERKHSRFTESSGQHNRMGIVPVQGWVVRHPLQRPNAGLFL